MNATHTARRRILRLVLTVILSVLLIGGAAASLRLAEAAPASRRDIVGIQAPLPEDQALVAAPGATPWLTFLPLAFRRYSAIPPLNVAPEVDSARAVSREMPLAGGSLMAVAANGARFTLAIPADALAVTTTITMTPLSAIQDLPADELAGAVLLEPAELFFYQPAMLTIEPAQAVPVAQEMTFSFYAEGSDFHRYPLLPEEPGVVIPVMFLRSYGLARLESATLQVNSGVPTVGSASFPAYRPASDWAQMAQEASDIVSESRVHWDPDYAKKMRDLYERYRDVLIKPLEIPSPNCDPASLNLAVAYAEQMLLLAGRENDDIYSDIIELVARVARHCYMQSAEPCVDWQDPLQARDVTLRHAFASALTEAYDPGSVVTPLDELPRCPIVEVRPGSDGGFIYPFQPDPESGWFTKVHFLFPDANARTVVHVNTLNNRGAGAPLAQVHARLKMPGQDWVDEDWTNLPYPWFCRDMAAGRIEELIITSSPVLAAPALAPSLDASNVGCWRWNAHVTMSEVDRPVGERGDSFDGTREGDVVVESQEARGVMELDVTRYGFNYALWAVQTQYTVLKAVAGQVDGHLVYNYVMPHDPWRTPCHYEANWSFAPHEQTFQYLGFSFNPRLRHFGASFWDDSEEGRVKCPPGTVFNSYSMSRWWWAVGGTSNNPFGPEGARITGTRTFVVEDEFSKNTRTITWEMTTESQP